MGRKVGLDIAGITAAAVEIVDAEGLEAATLSSVAARLGVKVPSLYNHVSGLAGLRRLITLAAVDQLTSALEAHEASGPADAGPGPAGGPAADSTGAELRRVAQAYRRFAIEHAGLYRSLLPAPSPDEDHELAEAMAAPVVIVAEAMRPFVGLTDGALAPGSIHLIRALRSLIHGFVDLEINRGFGLPVDIDESFDRAIATFADALKASSHR